MPILFFVKDSSGEDRMALSDTDRGGVFFVRGAENDDIRWLRAASEPYDGLMLSSANAFPLEITAIVEQLTASNREKAGQYSRLLTDVKTQIFAPIGEIPCENPFANANKVLDHFTAYSPMARSFPRPRLHGVIQISGELIDTTGDILDHFGLMPAKGYME